jgi:predicted chitinase
MKLNKYKCQRKQKVYHQAYGRVNFLYFSFNCIIRRYCILLLVCILCLLSRNKHSAAHAAGMTPSTRKHPAAPSSEPTESKPSLDGVTPSENTAGSRTKKVIFGGTIDPLDTIDHSLDVTNEGDEDTMPADNADQWKPTVGWMALQKNLVKRLNNHPVVPRRIANSNDFFASANTEQGNPNANIHLKSSNAIPEPKSNELGWNEDAQGVPNAIGDGAHTSGALNAMFEPFAPRQNPNSYDGGGNGDNVKAMTQAAKEEAEEDKKERPFNDWKESKKWNYKKNEMSQTHDIKTHYQQEEAWENEQVKMGRRFGEEDRKQQKDLNARRTASEQGIQKNRPTANSESNAEKLRQNEQGIVGLNNDGDVDGDAADQKQQNQETNNAKMQPNALDEMQPPGRASSENAPEGNPAHVLSAETEAERGQGNKKMHSISEGLSPVQVDQSTFTTGGRAPRPGKIPWIKTDPETGVTQSGGGGYLFQKCMRNAPGMCWLPYKCKNHGGTTVSGKCYGGGDTICCQNFQEYPINPLPLSVSPSSMPKPLFEGDETRLRGVLVKIGEREKALFDAIMNVGIKGVEACQFLAQMAHESDKFKAMEEYASGRAYEGREDLGNVRPGDGVKFKGRGYIQLTGRANYRYYGQVLGIDLEATPRRASELSVAAAVAVNYWFARVKSNKKLGGNFENTRQVTRLINGGSNGLADRIKKFKAYKDTLRL